MTRILTLSNMYPPHHLGGYELSCRDVMERLSALGHQVTVLTTRMQVPGVATPARERETGVLRDLEFYWEDHALLSPPLWRRLAIERHNQRCLLNALERVRPEVVSVWNMGAMSLGLLATIIEHRVPLLLCVCDDWLVYGRGLDAWSRLFARRPRAAAVAGLVAGVPTVLPDLGRSGTFCFVSRFTRGRAQDESGWTFPSSTVVYSGIDRGDFPPPTQPRTDREWRWRLLYVGRLDPRKGVETLVRTLARLPQEATLSLLGRGDQGFRARLEQEVAEAGCRERVFFGETARTELAAHYRDADAVVFPSEWDEPFGLVPVEAMACGTPVVATGTGGSTEFLVDGLNCLLYPRGDVDSLARALTRLAADPELRCRLTVGGLATAEELTVDRLAQVLERWHVAVAEGFRNGRPPHRPSPLRPEAGRACGDEAAH